MANLQPNPRSTAKIFGHPLHPMLVPFPIAGFVGALACDLVYRPGGDMFWFRAGEYLLGAGVVMALAAAAAVFGFDLMGEARIRALTIAWVHFIGNLVVVLIAACNWYRRTTMGEQAMSAGLILSVVTVLLMLVTGWLGWEMVYRRRVGIADTIG